jgi:TonB family protein
MSALYILRRKLSPTACLLAIFLALTSLATAQTTNIKDELQRRYKGKVFLIQGWYQDNELTYNSTGTVMGTPKIGSWSESAVKIRSIKIRCNDFVLKGYRGGFAYDPKTKKFGMLIGDKLEVAITVQADPATLTTAQLDALEHAIFTQSAKPDALPEYWRDFMVRGEQDPKKDGVNKGEIVSGIQSSSQPVYRIGDRVTAPRVHSHNEPDFTEVARQSRYQGTVLLSAVVDDHGMPTQLKILRPLGMGLDDAAIDCVEQWRFDPAKRDNKPVAVIVDIEISFKLY